MRLAIPITAFVLASAIVSAGFARTDGHLAIYEITTIGQKLDVASSAFKDGAAIPAKYSAYDKGISPPLAWSPGPQGTKTYVLIMEDPAAPTPKPFVHWVAYNINFAMTDLKEGASTAKVAFLQGKNGTGTTGYYGPRPPAGDRGHGYHFQVFALDIALELPAGAEREAVVAAMKGHVLAVGEVVGIFQFGAPPS